MSQASEGGGPARRSYPRTVPGLFGALFAVLALIAVVWGLSQFQARDVPDPARTVDYTSALSAARDGAPFDVLAPEPVPTGWRATSASWDGQGSTMSWHLGLLTADGQYVGLEQGNGSAASFISGRTTADQPEPPVVIRGQHWQSLSSADGSEHALVRSQGSVTTLVTGTAPLDELRRFAASLSRG